MSELNTIAEVTGAVKRYTAPEGGMITALNGISLQIQHKQFVTLLGPSGCGKTTLLKAISGFEDLDQGEVRIDGAAVTHVPPHKRPVNTVFQNYALFPHLTVENNVGYGLDVASIDRRERNQRVQETLERVGLGGFGRRKPKQLSGGQQQRVALARAIINRPKLLLLDEPLSALDRNLRQSMQLELKNLQHDLGICFLFVTHDQEEALTMSDQVVVLNKGQIEQIGPPEDHYHRPKTRFVAEFIGDGALFTGKTKGSANDLVLVTEDGLNLQLGSQARSSERATLLLRPEQLKFASADPNRSFGLLDAVLEQSVFYGATSKYVCLLKNGTSIAVTPTANDAEKFSRIKPGDSLCLAYDKEKLHVIYESQNDA